MAWSLPISGDFDGALREVTVSLEEFRGQNEPIFTGTAEFTAGSVNTALGRYDDALRIGAKYATWSTCPGMIGSPRAPESSWASWMSCAAASMRPGRCWRRRWT